MKRITIAPARKPRIERGPSQRTPVMAPKPRETSPANGPQEANKSSSGIRLNH